MVVKVCAFAARLNIRNDETATIMGFIRLKTPKGFSVSGLPYVDDQAPPQEVARQVLVFIA
jgi:hypothetical protein